LQAVNNQVTAQSPEKLTVAQLVKIFPTCQWTQCSLPCSGAHQRITSWVRWIQCTPSHPPL